MYKKYVIISLLLFVSNFKIYNMQDTPNNTEKETEEKKVCPICQYGMRKEKEIKIHCGHCFCKKCFQKLTVVHEINICPICRKVIDPSKPVLSCNFEGNFDYPDIQVGESIRDEYSEFEEELASLIKEFNIKKHWLFPRQKRLSKKR